MYKHCYDEWGGGVAGGKEAKSAYCVQLQKRQQLLIKSNIFTGHRPAAA